MPYLKINYDKSKPTFEVIDLPEESKGFLEACYKSIGCECIEVVPSRFMGLYLIIDESGKLKDGWSDRINPVASKLFGVWCDNIVGDAILAKASGSDLVPLNPSDVERVTLWLNK